MKKVLIGLVAMLALSMVAQAEDSMFCSEQLGGITTGSMQVRKLCINSQQLILSFEDVSNCHGFYSGNDRCKKILGKKFDEIFNIESIENNVKVDKLNVPEGVSISKINLLSLKCTSH